jgi:hypothetical protein
MYGHRIYMWFLLYNWGGLYEGRITISTDIVIFSTVVKCSKSDNTMNMDSTINKRKLYFLYTKVKSGLYMSTANLRKLEKSLSGFRSTGPWNITIPSEEPLFLFMFLVHKLMCLTANIANNSVVIKVLFIHQDSIKCRCSVSHYCTITLTVKSRNDGPNLSCSKFKSTQQNRI